jgi:uncharacterized membrane protein
MKIATNSGSNQTDSYRQIERLVNFSDAVIAIAVTLLILPLVDRASEIHVDSFGPLVHETGQQFLIFLLSFMVICRFWWVHHSLFQSLEKFNLRIFWLNSLWLLTIVFMPFPTVLIGRATGDASVATGIYIGTMLATSLAGLAIQRCISVSPGLQKPGSERVSLASSYATVILLLSAFLIAIIFPTIGPWSLLLLVLTSRFGTYLKRVKA